MRQSLVIFGVMALMGAIGIIAYKANLVGPRPQTTHATQPAHSFEQATMGQVVEKPPAAAAGAGVENLHASGESKSSNVEAVDKLVKNPPVPLADDAEKQRAGRNSGAQTRVTIEAEKKQYFIGEEIYINHVLENIGKDSFEFHKGGDYRGATRHLSYYIEAVHEDGTQMPDPDPNQMSLGGLGGTMKLAPGEKDTERLDLLAYRRLDRPGKYRISAGEDSVPATIELVVPTSLPMSQRSESCQ